MKTAPDTMDAACRLRAWFQGAVLPLWVEHGYDHERGGFYEALDMSGQPILDLNRRVRVQSRQIYVMSQASILGWHEGAGALADIAFENFLDKACPQMGIRGCAHILSPDGDVIDEKRDLYDQAFLLLAAAARWQATGDQRALDLAENVIRFLDKELTSPHGGWIESDHADMPRRQNPHMHLFESFMALHEATGDEKFAHYADKVFQLFEKHFYDRDQQILREFFKADLSVADGESGQLIEPGHMMEWVWLLAQYEKQRKEKTLHYCDALFRSAKRLGTDKNSLFLVDNIILGADTNGTRRLWPQTEYLQAAMVMSQAGNKDAEKLVEDLSDACLKTYLTQPVAGLWCDQFDVTGTPLTQQVPASMLYHLIGAIVAIQPNNVPLG